eukprot:CAMPEP_0181318004 /NCGR_PEP_ID=MMETSP1101-20121128/16773_1 /TAXON_ID=46948 /ORGANISM="Rhodomonas abbreviata, Strain Caron Lab Isolate" /LENGTH=392 /DNA_ID=CAMNT_0023425441 /DNA_START=71 /DNA_END=1245 /DNA_ORIENTATION=-
MSACFKFFSQVVSSIPLEQFTELCDASWKEDPNKALALFVWLGTFTQDALGEETRDEIRAGRKNFYRSMTWLYTNQPSTLFVNLEQIASHTSLECLLDLLMFVKLQTGPNSLEVNLASKVSNDDWRSNATAEKLQEEFDLFVRLETFSQLQVCLEPEGDAGPSLPEAEICCKETKLSNTVADIFARGLQQELECFKSGEWEQSKNALKFAMAAPTQRCTHDQQTGITNAIIERLFESELRSGCLEEARTRMKIRYQKEVLTDLRAAEQKRKLEKMMGMREDEFKRQALSVMRAPVRERREAMRSYGIMKKAVDEANRHAVQDNTPTYSLSFERLGDHFRFVAVPRESVTIGKRKVQAWRGHTIRVDADMVDAWEEKLASRSEVTGGGAMKER